MVDRIVNVELGERSYPVVIGHGVAARVDEYLPRGAKRAVVVTETDLPFRCSPKLDHIAIEVSPGESSKTLATIEHITRTFADFGLTRNDAVIAVGGGMITDVAGFAASCWHRGTSFVNVPTTLLGMVDAAVGGKTAVNLPEGKNLVGAFWQPTAVLEDLDALATLPEREMRCGLGEIAKYHFITGDDLLPLALEERIARCVRIKADIVAADERVDGEEITPQTEAGDGAGHRRRQNARVPPRLACVRIGDVHFDHRSAEGLECIVQRPCVVSESTGVDHDAGMFAPRRVNCLDQISFVVRLNVVQFVTGRSGSVRAGRHVIVDRR